MENKFVFAGKRISGKMQRIICLLFCFVCFVAKCTFLLRNKTLTLISDRLGDLASPVYLAGLDWSSIVNRTNYYGYGFKWIYFIFFKLFENPRVIYYSIYLFQYLVMAIVTVAFYQFYIRHFNENNDSLMMMFVLIFGMINASVSFSSEASVYLGFMILLMIFFKAYESQAKIRKCLWNIFLSFWLCYLITLHERCLAVIIAVILVVCFDWIYHRKCCIEPLSFSMSFAIFYFVEEKLTDKVLNTLWAQRMTSGTIKNTTVSIKNPLWFLESKEAIFTFIKTGFSNLITAICKSYGLWFIMFFMLAVGVIAFVFRNKDFKCVYECNRELILGNLICVGTAVIIFIGVAQRWGRGILNGGSRGPEYYYRGMTYVRYYKPFILCGCALGIGLWEKVKDSIRARWKYVGVFLLAASLIYFYCCISPVLLEKQTDALSDFIFIDFEGIGKRYEVFACMILSLIISFFFLVVNKKIRNVFCVSILAMIVIYSSEFYNVRYPVLKMRFENTVQFIDEVETSAGLDKSEVYYYKTEPYGDSINEHTFQFSMPRYSVNYGWPERNEVLVVSPSDNEALIKKKKITENTPYISLDKGVFIYIVGDDLCRTISSYGYDIQYE